MRYFKFTYDNGYVNTGNDKDYIEFNDDVTDIELKIYGEETLNLYAEEWEHLATGYGEDFENEEDKEMYYENCTFTYEEITEQEYYKCNEYAEKNDEE